MIVDNQLKSSYQQVLNHDNVKVYWLREELRINYQ